MSNPNYPPPCCECGKPASHLGIHYESGPSYYCLPCVWVPIRDGELKYVRKLPMLPQEGGGAVNTPRTDAEAGHYDDSGCWRHRMDGETVPVEFARQLETELARCRLALARGYDIGAKCSELSEDPERAHKEREQAARLRDLSKPTPEVLP